MFIIISNSVYIIKGGNAVSGYQTILSAKHRKEMVASCANFVIKDLRPLYALEGDGIRELLGTFNFMCQIYNPSDLKEISYFLPHRDTVAAYIHNISTKIRYKIKEKLKDVFGIDGPGGAISLDIWTDDFKQQSYICLIVHYIDDDFNLKKRVIANEYMSSKLKKDHAYILEIVNRLLKEFEIEDTSKIVFVTDRGSNMVSALMVYNHISCSLHFLSNVVKQMFIDGKPLSILNKCRKIVQFIKKSGKIDQFSPSLKSPSSIRWNYSLTMLGSLTANTNWNKMTSIIQESSKASLLDELQKEEVEHLVHFLELFQKATVSMEATTHPTIHRTSAWYDAIEIHLRQTEDDSNIVSEAKRNSEAYFLLKKEKYKQYLLSDYHRMSEFLHPALKKLAKLTPHDRARLFVKVSTQLL